jgi:hypothetical protein
VVGADENAPYRAGRYLETPQRLGILPTWAFWNRQDVWKSARWIVAPVAGLTGAAVSMAGAFDLPMWIVAAAPASIVLVIGLMERHVRRELRRPWPG